MTDRRVRYARNGSVRLAYREFGDGDTTLVWNPGWFSNVDLVDEPASPIAAVAEQLGGGHTPHRVGQTRHRPLRPGHPRPSTGRANG